MEVYLGLVHYPIKNKTGDIVTTSVTNMDIHDISRSCRTFGIEKYFIISPLQAQKSLVNRILGHWDSDNASVYNPDRKDALSVALFVESLELAIDEIEKRSGKRPLITVTAANMVEDHGCIKDMKLKAEIDNRPILLLFGTGWGLAPEVIDMADFKLGPIYGRSDDGFNHLSVRSAVAIYLSQL
ncbi:MAG: RNA methyltransferase [Bacteriovoracaceae bacterium]